jgi:hypothetical protein
LGLDGPEHNGVANAQSESVAAVGMESHQIDDRARSDDVQRVDGLDFFRARGIDTSRRYYPNSATVLVRLEQ